MTPLITDHLAVWTTAPNGIKKLRELILELAVRGLLVPQDPNDEPASELLKKIAAEKARLVSEGKIKPPKPLAKISEEEKPFSLPMGWEFVRLDDIGSTNIGLTYSPNDISNKGIPVLRSSNVQNGKIDLNDLVRVEKDIKSSVFAEEGDLLICARNGSKSLVGKTAMIKNLSEKMTFGAFMAIYRSEYNAYIEVFLNSPVFRNSLEGVNTTTINQITQGNLKSTLTPLPPLAEQQRIVAKVDELMQLCDRLEEKQNGSQEMHRQLVSCLLTALTEATDAQAFQAAWSRIAENFDCLFTTESSIEQLKQTILQLAVMGKLVPQDPNDEPASELLKKIATEKARLITEGKIKKQNPLPKISEQEKPFALPDGWEWCRVWDVTQLVTSGSRDWAKYYSTSGAIFVTMGNLSRNEYKLRMNTVRYVNLSKDEEGSRTQLETNDLLLSITGDVGNLGLIPEGFGEAYINQHTCLLRFIPQCRNLYFPELMRSPLAKYQFNAPQRGIKNSFRLSDVGEMIIPLPPLPEQHRIVTKVDELMTLCEQLKTRLATAQTLQQQLAETLVQQAVA